MVTVAIFVIYKVLFMLLYPGHYAGVSLADRMSVIAHGLPMDLSVAGYLTIIPALLVIARVWTARRWVKIVEKGY